MIRARLALLIIIALGVSTPVEAGFWSDLKRSFGTAVDNAGHDGAKAVDAVGDAVSDGAESASDYVAGESGSTDNAPPQHVDNTEQPVTNNPEQLSTQPEQQP